MQQGCRGHLPGPGTRSLMNHAPDTHLRYGGGAATAGSLPEGSRRGGCMLSGAVRGPPCQLSASAPRICGTVLSHGFSPARSHFFWSIG